MNAKAIQPFTWSLLLHGVFAAVAVFCFLMFRSNPMPELSLPLTLVTAPVSQGVDDVGTPRPMLIIPAPRVAPVTRAISDESTSAREPTRPHVKQTTVAPRQQISIDDFRRDHPASAPHPKPIPRVPGSLPAPPSATPVTPATDLVEATFADALLSDLRGALADAGATAPAGTVAVVEFALARDGRLNDVEIARSSGSPDFDAAIRAAFKQVRARGFQRPDVGRTYVVKFRANRE